MLRNIIGMKKSLGLKTKAYMINQNTMKIEHLIDILNLRRLSNIFLFIFVAERHTTLRYTTKGPRSWRRLYISMDLKKKAGKPGMRCWFLYFVDISNCSTGRRREIFFFGKLEFAKKLLKRLWLYQITQNCFSINWDLMIREITRAANKKKGLPGNLVVKGWTKKRKWLSAFQMICKDSE